MCGLGGSINRYVASINISWCQFRFGYNKEKGITIQEDPSFFQQMTNKQYIVKENMF